MIKKISKIPFRGTPEQEARLKAIINESKHDKHLLMTVMQKAQDIYGYLPFEVQVMIAEGMEVLQCSRNRPRRMHRGYQVFR